MVNGVAIEDNSCFSTTLVVGETGIHTKTTPKKLQDGIAT